MRTAQFFASVIVIGVVACGARQSIAADAAYPTKPIRLIVASSPGGPNDLVARAIGPPWSDRLGRPIVIDNRAGAAGAIGTEIVARAAPDGHTLLLGFQGPLAIAPNLVGTPYDSLRDFAPVSLVVSAPFLLLAHPRVPAHSLKELIALAKFRPGKLNYASGGTGIGSHLSMELLLHVAGARMTHVPYKGAGPGLAALIAGEVDAMFASVSAAIAHVRAERLRALAVGGNKRSALLPDLPTVRESGFPVSAASWYGVLAPRGTPQLIISRLHRTLVEVVNAPATKSRLSDLAFEVSTSTPQELAQLIRDEMATWNKLITDLGLKGKV